MNRLKRHLILLMMIAATICNIISYNSSYEHLCDKYGIADKNEFYFECVADEFPIIKDDTMRLYCTVEKTDYPAGDECKILVRLPAELYGNATIGSRLSFTSAVQIPDTAMNYGSFSYRNYLKSKNTIGIAQPDADKVTITESTNSLAKHMYELRRSVIANIEKYFDGSECALMKAILTGDRESISEDMFNSYKKTGIYHIVAVSGLHAGIFVALLAGCLARLPFRRRKKVLAVRSFSVGIAVLLLMFTGYGVSVMRVIVMLMILFAAMLMRRQYSLTSSLLFAAMFILLIAPYQIFSLSFQLSFLSTLGLATSLEIYRRRARLLDENDFVATSVAISVGSFAATFIVSVYNFGLVSFASLMANIVIIPLASVLLTTLIGFCAASLVLPSALLNVLRYIPLVPARLINCVSDIISKLPFSSAELTLRGTLWIFTAALPILAIICTLRRRKPLMAVCIAIVLTANSAVTLIGATSDDVKVSFLNSGKGECTLITDNFEKAVIDCGSASSKSPAEDIFEPYFRHNGVHTINKLFISYFDRDHTNAVNDLLNGGYVREIVIPPTSNIKNEKVLLERRKILNAAAISGVKVSQIHAGYPIHATKDVTVSVYTDKNLDLKDKNGCAVYEINYGSTNFVLSSCLGAKGQELLSRIGSDCDVLKIPSYGSAVKASGKFISSFDPDYAVITSPPQSKYYIFDRKMSEILRRQKIKYARTDKNKTITFVTDGTKIKSVSASKGELR